MDLEYISTHPELTQKGSDKRDRTPGHLKGWLPVVGHGDLGRVSSLPRILISSLPDREVGTLDNRQGPVQLGNVRVEAVSSLSASV